MNKRDKRWNKANKTPRGTQGRLLHLTYPLFALVDRSTVNFNNEGTVEALGPNTNFYFVNLKAGQPQVDIKCIGLFTTLEAASRFANTFGLPEVATAMGMRDAPELVRFLTHPKLQEPGGPTHGVIFTEESRLNPAPPGPFLLPEFINAIRECIDD